MGMRIYSDVEQLGSQPGTWLWRVVLDGRLVHAGFARELAVGQLRADQALEGVLQLLRTQGYGQPAARPAEPMLDLDAVLRGVAEDDGP